MSDSIDIYDRDILRYLLRKRKPATIHEIANTLRLSWNTVRIHLLKLKDLGLVECTLKKGTAISYWYITRRNGD